MTRELELGLGVCVCVLVALGRMRTWRRGLADDAWEWRDGSLEGLDTERWLVKKELAFFSYRLGRQSVLF